jgi:hypothetical protein
MDIATLARSVGIYDVLEPWYSSRQIRNWKRAGRPIPAPSAVKRDLLRAYARDYGLRVLIETGTYKADTVRALRGDFDLIHSVEVSESLYGAAVARCRHQSNARIHLGDSAEVLPRIVEDLHQPAIFWLDAHFSGGITGGEDALPIIAEFQACLDAAVGHVVLVDDIREFGQSPGYPTVQTLAGLSEKRGYSMEVRDDVARLVPKNAHPVGSSPGTSASR